MTEQSGESKTQLIEAPEPEPPTEEETVAQGILPYLPGSAAKQEYLALRACGYSVREALVEVKVSQRTIERWRKDDALFAHYDSIGLAELRRVLGNKVILVEFTRNYHKILKKDLDVLNKTLDQLTEVERQYLNRRTAHYSPEQLERLQRIAKTGQVSDKDIGEFLRDLGQMRDKARLTLTERKLELENYDNPD